MIVEKYLLLKLAILISGRGSNMKAILDAIKKQNINIKPAVIISNKSSAKGLKIAKKFKVKTEIIESKGFQGSRWEYDQKIIKILKKYQVTPTNGLICLAGFMRIISPKFIKKYPNPDAVIYGMVMNEVKKIKEKKLTAAEKNKKEDIIILLFATHRH